MLFGTIVNIRLYDYEFNGTFNTAYMYISIQDSMLYFRRLFEVRDGRSRASS